MAPAALEGAGVQWTPLRSRSTDRAGRRDSGDILCGYIERRLLAAVEDDRAVILKLTGYSSPVIEKPAVSEKHPVYKDDGIFCPADIIPDAAFPQFQALFLPVGFLMHNGDYFQQDNDIDDGDKSAEYPEYSEPCPEHLGLLSFSGRFLLPLNGYMAPAALEAGDILCGYKLRKIKYQSVPQEFTAEKTILRHISRYAVYCFGEDKDKEGAEQISSAAGDAVSCRKSGKRCGEYICCKEYCRRDIVKPFRQGISRRDTRQYRGGEKY